MLQLTAVPFWALLAFRACVWQRSFWHDYVKLIFELYLCEKPGYSAVSESRCVFYMRWSQDPSAIHFRFHVESF